MSDGKKYDVVAFVTIKCVCQVEIHPDGVQLDMDKTIRAHTDCTILQGAALPKDVQEQIAIGLNYVIAQKFAAQQAAPKEGVEKLPAANTKEVN